MRNRTSKRAAVAAVVVLPLWLASAEARAQAQAANVDPATLAAAQALHREAVAALDAKDYATACPKLARVVAMIPEGLGAQLTLAECYEGAGRLASAWATYSTLAEAAGKAGQQEREKIAKKKVAELRPKLAELTVVVPESVRALPGLEIRRGDAVLDPAQWSVAVPIDAGDHRIAALVAGEVVWESWVKVEADGVRKFVEVEPSKPKAAARPVMAPVPRAALPAQAAVPAQAVRSKPDDAATTWSAQHIAGIAVGGVGVVSFGVGVGFGVRAIAKRDASNADGHCHDGNFCDDEGFALREDGRTAGTVSTVLFVVGGAALAGGLTLFLMAPNGQSGPKAEVALGPEGLALRGRW